MTNELKVLSAFDPCPDSEGTAWARSEEGQEAYEAALERRDQIALSPVISGRRVKASRKPLFTFSLVAAAVLLLFLPLWWALSTNPPGEQTDTLVPGQLQLGAEFIWTAPGVDDPLHLADSFALQVLGWRGEVSYVGSVENDLPQPRWVAISDGTGRAVRVLVVPDGDGYVIMQVGDGPSATLEVQLEGSIILHLPEAPPEAVKAWIAVNVDGETQHYEVDLAAEKTRSIPIGVADPRSVETVLVRWIDRERVVLGATGVLMD